MPGIGAVLSVPAVLVAGSAAQTGAEAHHTLPPLIDPPVFLRMTIGMPARRVNHASSRRVRPAGVRAYRTVAVATIPVTFSGRSVKRPVKGAGTGLTVRGTE
ncbi:hypothetical protein GCM10012287_10870 [Streptomyces daqingensis]|uniref:Secreted protein n=1 Tax=Streptomyces daqingensis TaxID=1472640 RepID=A0ABQ2LXT8_9ACTN|nr:hypothetical protein GCM10012287_10870 [Streptomyces daqingensis]